MTTRRGLNLARVIGTNVWPKDPVPPVMRMDELASMVTLFLLCFSGMTECTDDVLIAANPLNAAIA